MIAAATNCGPTRTMPIDFKKHSREKTMKAFSDKPSTRRAVLGGAAVAGAAVISAPYIRNAEAAEPATWKVQTAWPAGVGLNTFKTWAATIKEKTGGELEFKPCAAKEVVGDFELLDG